MRKRVPYKQLFIVAFLLVSFNSFSQKCHRVFVNMTADYTFYENYNFNDVYVESEMEASFNYAAQIYQQYGIHLVKGYFTIIKNENEDPYKDLETFLNRRYGEHLFDTMLEQHKTLGGDGIDEFGVNPYTNELGYTYDVDILFTGPFYTHNGSEGNKNGQAKEVGNFLSDDAHVLIRNVFDHEVVTLSELFAHEIGHVFNGNHCDAIFDFALHNCDNDDAFLDTVEQSIMHSPFLDPGGAIPIISSNNLMNMKEVFNYHRDFVYTSDASPLGNTHRINTSDLYQSTAILTANSEVTTNGDSTIFLLKSSEVVNSTGPAKFVPQGSSKIKMIIDPSLNDYCSPSTNTSSLRSASLKLERKSQIKNGLSANSVLDKSISLYPNPATNYINIDFSLAEKSIVKVSVFDYVGRYLFDLENTEFSKGSHEKQYDVSNLSMGIYIVKVNTMNGSKSFQVVKS